jgi:hypothetical protein
MHPERGDAWRAACLDAPTPPKLAGILHRMLCDGSDFRWSAKEGQAA